MLTLLKVCVVAAVTDVRNRENRRLSGDNAAADFGFHCRQNSQSVNGRYSSARFVSVNGEAYLIQRGVDVEVPAAVAEVLRHSEEMDNAANAKIEAAQAAAQNVPALQKL